MILPQAKYISGSGKPRLMVLKATPLYTSGTGTTFTASSVSVTTNLTGLVLPGMRITGYLVNTGYEPKAVYAKVLSAVYGSTSTLTVDSWVGGTPTNGQVIVADGYVMDLPYCKGEGLVEVFEPDYNLHELYRGDRGTAVDLEFRGWKYNCVLHYEQYLKADTLLLMKPALSIGANDTLVIIPRVDTPGFNYVVYYSGPIQIARFPGVTAGHRNVAFGLKGVENVAGWPLISGYGTAYATVYGTNL